MSLREIVLAVLLFLLAFAARADSAVPKASLPCMKPHCSAASI